MTKIEKITNRCAARSLTEAQELLDAEMPGYKITEDGQIYDENDNRVSAVLWPKMK
jgi:hypothetical protein